MFRTHLFLLCSALPLIACSGGGGGPEGPQNPYVVSEVSVPTTNPQAMEIGLDLNGDKVVDNQLGAVLAALSTSGFKVQDALTKAINEGDIVLLASIQTSSFSSSGNVGFRVFIGDTATVTPAPCTSTTDTACRHHLDGNGSFTIAASSPTDAEVTGKISGGTFTGGPGDISLKIALGSTDGVQLDLIGARAKATGISATAVDSIIVAGALTQDDLNSKVIPEIFKQLGPIVTSDCPTGVLPDCGCTAGSTGKTILSLFDNMPKDCKLVVEEIQNSTLLKSLLAPDVTIDGKMAISLGVKVKATKATFTVPE
jgi:hypothetical protein